MTAQIKSGLSRRAFLGTLAALGAAGSLRPLAAAAQPSPILERAIPATGETVPAIGMGTWITFNVGADQALRDQRADVLRAFFEQGGAVIDSSPMYGSSEEVVGYCLERLSPSRESVFAASKVWTLLQLLGERQLARSHELWGLKRMDLMQVHNLLNWESHLETLRERKEQGSIRYVGVTTSHGRRHDDLEQLMRKEPLDFVQLTYNVLDREAERRLLPLAADRGLAVLINRPFQGGSLFERFERQPLPEWVDEIDCDNWAQFFLKFIVSHPAVTCAIPATSRVDHMQENMGALRGQIPDVKMRARMVAYVESL